jgi:ATP dependent DNA ligase domain
MLATLGRAPFDDPVWVYEPKWDGFRVIAMTRGGSVQLLSRNLHPFTALFRPISEALEGFPTPLVSSEIDRRAPRDLRGGLLARSHRLRGAPGGGGRRGSRSLPMTSGSAFEAT